MKQKNIIHYFKADNTSELAKMNLKNILNNGIIEKRRVGQWCLKKDGLEKMLETHSIVFELTNPKNCITSQHCLGVEVETEDYFLGLNPGYVHLSPWGFYKKWLQKNGKYHYTYGSRGGIYINDIVNKLKNDSTSRHVVISLFDTSKDLNNEFVPCSTQWIFYIVKNKLYMTTTMRSQDACRGFFLDTFAYPLIQQIIAKRLGIEMGSYYHIIFNSHIYYDDIAFAKKLLISLKTVGKLEIDNLSNYDIEILRQSSYILYKKHDTVLAQKIASQLPDFWYKWKANQIIYIYTKYISKQEHTTELTCEGVMMNAYP